MSSELHYLDIIPKIENLTLMSSASGKITHIFVIVIVDFRTFVVKMSRVTFTCFLKQKLKFGSSLTHIFKEKKSFHFFQK